MASFPQRRLRRLRANETLRRMVRENHLRVDDLIYPLFVVEGNNIQTEISSMPGCYHFSVEQVGEECKQVRALGSPAVMLFGIREL